MNLTHPASSQFCRGQWPEEEDSLIVHAPYWLGVRQCTTPGQAGTSFRDYNVTASLQENGEIIAFKGCIFRYIP